MDKVVEVIQCKDIDAINYNRYKNEALRKKYPEDKYIFRANYKDFTFTVIHSPARMMLVFAQIDAKGGFTGYHTLGVYSRLYPGDAISRSEHNLRVLYRAEHKYLRELDTLQQRIRDEFEPQLVYDVEMSLPPKDIATKIEKEEFFDVIGMFRHLFYT